MVEIARAGEEPHTRVPMDLRKALGADPLAQAGWEDITPMARRDWIFSISSAKQPETRSRRIEKACGTVSAEVRHEYPVTRPNERRDHLVPRVHVVGKAVEEDDREALWISALFVPHAKNRGVDRSS